MDCKAAVQLQKKLKTMVKKTKIKKSIKTIAGLDCAFSKDKKQIFASVVMLKFPGLEPIESAYAVDEVKMPYVPGLLSFREAPACIKAAQKLKHTPDLFLVDGQGIAHPRRLGIAAHLGLFFQIPTIGCAKSRLTGTYRQPQPQKGKHTLLYDKDEIIGAVLRTRTNVKPVFVSIGHLCTLEDALKYTLKCSIKYRLPEPARIAHNQVAKIKKKYQ